MTTQETTLLAEINTTTVTTDHVKRASGFMGALPYTATALSAMAHVCEHEFDNTAMARILHRAAVEMAELEAATI